MGREAHDPQQPRAVSKLDARAAPGCLDFESIDEILHNINLLV
jgi:hypothetical protein